MDGSDLITVPVERELASHVEARVLDRVDTGVADILIPNGHPLALDISQGSPHRLVAVAVDVASLSPGFRQHGPGWQFD